MIQTTDTRTKTYLEEIIRQAVNNITFISTKSFEKLAASSKCMNVHYGKVRDIYFFEDYVILFTSDRQSAFDRQLASIPYKGQVLNLVSLWWFNETKHIVPNHVLSSPHPNVLIAKKTKVFPIEFVMRGYITGTTSTSLWTHYAKGVRDYCGHHLPNDLKKNQKLEKNLLTPTTKDDEHDELISAEQIIKDNIMSETDWNICAKYAHDLFAYSQSIALQKGLILVDTKYEFGRDEKTGEILLIDEVQTPDSSRYWISDTYQQKFDADDEPDNIDKEFLRKWFVAHCNPYEDKTLPEAPLELVTELSRRYIQLYEVITGQAFDIPTATANNAVLSEMEQIVITAVESIVS